MSDKRVTDATLNANYVDGQILQHTDMNGIIDIFKTAINANYDDINQLKSGEVTNVNAAKLEGLVATTFNDGPLKDDDETLPTSKKVKEYVDNKVIEATPVEGVDYFTEIEKAEFKSDITNSVISDASSEFVEIVNQKTDDFNSNVSTRTVEFNTNYDDKLTAFNNNAIQKTNAFNDNYEEKLDNLNKQQYRVASETDLGAVKVGEGLEISGDGTLSTALKEVSWDIVTNKPFIPEKTSELENDEQFQTLDEVNQAITDAIGGITGFDYKKVDVLPETGEKGIIYLVPKAETGDDIFDEYMWLAEDNRFEFIGTTAVDLSEYYKKDEVDDLLDDKADKTDLPKNVSELTNDSGYLTEETDPVFSASAAATITDSNINNWNNKSDFSGNYNDLDNKPSLAKVATSGSYTDLTNKPSVPTKVSDLDNDAGYLTEETEVIIGNEEPTSHDWKAWFVPGRLINNTVADTLPIGTITEYAGEEAPDNWLICDGREVSRGTYSELFSILGTTYGSGDGSTTFNVPDYRGRIGVGKSTETEFNNLGKTGGEKTHTLNVDEMPSHNHSTAGAGGTSGYPYRIAQIDGIAGDNSYCATLQTGGDQPHNNLQPYIVTNYIIKAFSSSVIEGSVLSTKSNSTKNTYSCDYINKKVNIYATDEQVIGTWLGKPLYRKTITTTNTNGTSGWKEYTYSSLGLSNDIEEIHFSDVFTYLTQENYFYCENFYSNGCRIQSAGARKIVSILGNGVSYNKYVIVAEYIKTTD